MAPSVQENVAAFCSALRFVGGEATVVTGGFEAAAAVERFTREAGTGREVLYEPFDLAEELGLPLSLKARGLRLLPVASAGKGAAAAAVGLTGAVLAVAESGTLLVGGRPGGWGLATVLPWVHVALIRAEDIRVDLADAFLEFRLRFEEGERDWVWISGPSKTADIAKTLVTGIHGPNAVRVLVLDAAGASG